MKKAEFITKCNDSTADAINDMKKQLQEMIKALDKPFLYKKETVEYTEDYPGKEYYENKTPIEHEG